MYQELEQVRFIMTAPTGHERDIPWESWTAAKRTKDKEAAASSSTTDHNKAIEIDNLTAVKRLKITTVQTAYTRQEPLDSDLFLSGETEGY